MIRLTLLLMLGPLLLVNPGSVSARQCSEFLDFNVRTLNEDTQVNLCKAYQGKVILVVNTASKCAYTDQYEQLEALYEKHNGDGLVVLGFPSNDFGGQEPGSEQQIQNFCINTYAVKFPMFHKTRVKAANADPLFKKLGDAAGYPQWNFHKYLLDREGNLVQSFRSSQSPESPAIQSAIQGLLYNE